MKGLYVFALILVTTINPVFVKLVGNVTVIIVGAGSSGIAAATKLYENGVTDIVILEAENRIGGRIYTKTFGNATVELGAEYCHGEKDNVVFELANKYDLLKPIEKGDTFYYSSGENINQTFFNNMYSKLTSIYDNMVAMSRSGMSANQYLRDRFEQDILDVYKDDKKELQQIKDLIKYFITTTTSHEGALSLSDVSSKSYFEECEGHQDIIWKYRGYKTILDILLKRYPNPEDEIPIESKTLLNKEVAEIAWNDENSDGKVIIKCSDGSSYSADHVIFTPSLGVLKANHESIFQPSLPKRKVTAIEKLGIHAVSKIFLHFPKKWWPDDEFSTFMLLWTEEDRQSALQEFSNGPTKNDNSWVANIADIYGINNSSVLVAWVNGKFVPEVEQLTDKVIIDGIMYALKKFLGRKFPDITHPDALLWEKWYSNPHFRGTYSYETLESWQEGVDLHEILAQPLLSSEGKAVVLFAGEATHTKHHSTVHGAIETGFREAQRIIDLYS